MERGSDGREGDGIVPAGTKGYNETAGGGFAVDVESRLVSISSDFREGSGDIVTQFSSSPPPPLPPPLPPIFRPTVAYRETARRGTRDGSSGEAMLKEMPGDESIERSLLLR